MERLVESAIKIVHTNACGGSEHATHIRWLFSHEIRHLNVVRKWGHEVVGGGYGACSTKRKFLFVFKILRFDFASRSHFLSLFIFFSLSLSLFSLLSLVLYLPPSVPLTFLSLKWSSISHSITRFVKDERQWIFLTRTITHGIRTWN